jgi:hypothetical protein
MFQQAAPAVESPETSFDNPDACALFPNFVWRGALCALRCLVFVTSYLAEYLNRHFTMSVTALLAE